MIAIEMMNDRDGGMKPWYERYDGIPANFVDPWTDMLQFLVQMGSPVRYFVVFLLLLLIGVGGFLWFGDTGTRGYPEPMPVDAILKRPLQFSGNRYHLEASVENVVASEDGLGRIVFVSSLAEGAILPLFVPDGLEENLQFQQRFVFRLSVEDGGLFFVRDLSKI